MGCPSQYQGHHRWSVPSSARRLFPSLNWVSVTIGAVGGGTILVVVVIILFFVIRRNREDSDGNRQPKSRHPADAQWESIFRYYPNASSGHTLVLNLPPEPHVSF